jgi:hypothetical protein
MARRRSGKRAGEAGVSQNGATVGHEAELWARAAEGMKLDAAIAENLKRLGFAPRE